MLTVLWHEEGAEGYTDLLPDEWFLKEVFLHAKVHDVRGPRSGLYKAKCNVKVSSASADLDYEAFARFNTKHEMCLGIMRIQLESKNRVRVTQVLWKEKGDKSFVPCSTTIGHEQPNSTESALPKDIDLLEVSTAEGRIRLVTHLKRERSSKLVATKKKAVLAANGRLSCEACTFTFEDNYGELGKSFCEVHHRKPLAAGSSRKTSLKDLAILCSNCHRMIHRTDPMLSVEKFSKIWLTKKSNLGNMRSS